MKKYIIATILLALTFNGVSAQQAALLPGCTDLRANLNYNDVSVGSNNDIARLQRFLKSLGLFDPVVGIRFGNKTREAVIAYQNQHSITPTGNVGPVTREAIRQQSCFGVGGGGSTNTNDNGNTVNANGSGNAQSNAVANLSAQKMAIIDSVIRQHSRLFGFAIASTTMSSFNDAMWTTSCLGVVRPSDGMTCVSATFTGYAVKVRAGGTEYEYHTTIAGTPIRSVTDYPVCHSEQYLENGTCKDLTHRCLDGRVITMMLSCSDQTTTPVTNSLPDLVQGAVTIVQKGPSVNGGTSVTYKSTITNQGANFSQYDISNGGVTTYFQVVDKRFGATFKGYSLSSVAGVIASSVSKELSVDGTGPSVLILGDYKVRACADESPVTASSVVTPNSIFESNETNNCSAWTEFSITRDGTVAQKDTSGVLSVVDYNKQFAPDLTSTSFKIYENGQLPIRPSDVIAFETTMKNIGGASTRPVYAWDYLYTTFQMSRGSNGQGVISDLVTQYTRQLLTGEEQKVIRNYDVPQLSAGSYSFRACVDNKNGVGEVVEANETNNCSPWDNYTVNAQGEWRPAGYVTTPDPIIDPLPVRLTLNSPSEGATYTIGRDQIPISWSITNLPSNSQVVYQLKLISQTGPGDISGSSGQDISNGGRSLSQGQINIQTGYMGNKDIPGTYELSVMVKDCVAGGCLYANNIPTSLALEKRTITLNQATVQTIARPTSTFTQTSSATTSGEPYTVEWTSQNASSCKFEYTEDGGAWQTYSATALSGAARFTSTTATFEGRLTCTGVVGSTPDVKNLYHSVTQRAVTYCALNQEYYYVSTVQGVLDKCTCPSGSVETWKTPRTVGSGTFSCVSDTQPTPTGSPAIISFSVPSASTPQGTSFSVSLNASNITPNSCNVQFKLVTESDWRSWFTDVSSGTHTGFESTPAGSYQLKARCAGTNGLQYDSAIVPHTISAAQTNTRPVITFSVPSSSTVQGTPFAVSLNASNVQPNTCSVDFKLVTESNWRSWFQNVSSGTHTGFESTPAGSYQLKARCVGTDELQYESAIASHTILSSATSQPTATLTQSKETTVAGEAFTVDWTSANATDCRFEFSQDNEGTWRYYSSGLNHSYTFRPTRADFDGRLTCNGGQGSTPVVKKISHRVTAAAITQPTATLTQSKDRTVAGEAFSVGWTSQNTVDCKFEFSQDNGLTWRQYSSGLIQAHTFRPTRADFDGRLTCTGQEGSIPVVKTISHSVTDSVTQPTATLTQSKTRTTAGEAFTVGWTSQNAKFCKFEFSQDNGVTWKLYSVGLSQRYTFRPTRANFDGRLTCTGDEGSTPVVKTISHSVVSSVSLVNDTPMVLGVSTGSQTMSDSAAQNICVNISRNIHRGDESIATRQLQSYLAKKDFLSADDITGFYGDKTVQAVKDYQGTLDLAVTGMVYERTREAIFQETCK